MRAKDVKRQKPDSPGVGRWIKRYLALRTCRDVMRRAEQERLEVAELEAKRGVDKY